MVLRMELCTKKMNEEWCEVSRPVSTRRCRKGGVTGEDMVAAPCSLHLFMFTWLFLIIKPTNKPDTGLETFIQRALSTSSRNTPIIDAVESPRLEASPNVSANNYSEVDAVDELDME